MRERESCGKCWQQKLSQFVLNVANYALESALILILKYKSLNLLLLAVFYSME